MQVHYKLPASSADEAANALRDFISTPSFPCVGAKSALNKGRLTIREFGRLATPETTQDLYESLIDYSAKNPEPGQTPVSFAATFSSHAPSELVFEELLWKQLIALHEVDRCKGITWNSEVSEDPESSQFSFSIGGRAYFVVGMHPNASRLARRTPIICLIFNFHDQFEALKTTGKYSSLQRAIRERDIALQGSINPVLARFGESSEARQYSGRPVDQAWQCPFHHKD